MQWLFTGLMVAFAAWGVWRGIEAYTFNKLMNDLGNDLSDANIRSVLERLNTRNVPNANAYWARLREMEKRVAAASNVSSDVKAEFRAQLAAKAGKF